MARSAPVDRAAGSPGAPGRPGTILRMLVAGTTWSGRADPQEASSDRHRSLADRQPPRTGADDDAWVAVPLAAAHHRSQDDRQDVPGHRLHVLPRRRVHGAADAGGAGPAGAAVPQPGAVQPAVHHARHDHAAVLRDADGLRVREPGAAAADRRPGRELPAAERLLILALPL